MREPTKFRRIILLSNLVFGRKDQRRDALFYLFSFIARSFGFRLYSRYMKWFSDENYISLWNGFPVRMKGIEDRKYNLFHLATSIADVPGDTVECGVLRGESSMIIMKCTQGTDKVHHIFDSFEGLSEVASEDAVQDQSFYQWQENDLSVSKEIVEENLAQFQRKKLYRGWIPDRFRDVEDRKFSLVHIDVDLYQPTLDAISFFYERVSPGGMIVCDDYGSEACPGAYQAVNEFMADKAEHVIHLTTGQSLVIKR